MSIGLFNKDQSFFTVSSPDYPLETKVIQDDIISLSITEEMGKIEMGSLVLQDNRNVYSRIFRPGAMLDLTWGYRAWNAALGGGFTDIISSDVINQNLERRGLRMFVTSPSGSAGQNGVINFSCNMLARDMRGDQQVVVYRTGTKADIVRQVMERLGVTRFDIRFERGQEVTTPDTAVRQWESDFRFLVRYSIEWRSIFKIGFDQQGQLVGMFVDPDKLSTSPFTAWVTGANRQNQFFEYKETGAKVLSYRWKDRSAESGQGANVQIRIVNGQPTFYRYVTENQTVRSYRLVPERIEAALEEQGLEGGIAGQVELLNNWLNVEDFEEIRRFFEPVDASTAPQGIGYELEMKTLGNVAYAVGAVCDFGTGFPDVIGNTQSLFYLYSVNHQVTSEGYFCDCKIVDVYAISPTGQRL